MIAVDWGTTNFRAFRLEGGRVVERIGSGPGLLQVPAGGFADALRAAVGPWLDAGEDRVLMAGMVGSRQGWVEAPYLRCPADLALLAASAIAVPFEGAVVRLVPGLSATDAEGTPEVMRGEEVQVAGVLERTGPDAVVCLPGTHAKWVRLRGGRVEGFSTHMTGEVFSALRQHTILGRSMAEGAPEGTPGGALDAGAFRRGVDHAGAPGGLLHHLFGVRTLGLFGRLDADTAADFLSGLLIGHEVRTAVAELERGPVHLVGSAGLCARYAAAIEQVGGVADIMGEDAAAAGLARLSEHVTWT